jgi:hypothetical protein
MLMKNLRFISKFICVLVSILPVFTIYSPVYGQTKAITISICALNYSTEVDQITFPANAPNTVISSPFNNINGAGNAQTFGVSSRPVVTLVNTGDISYTIWYQITSFENGVVSSEFYRITDIDIDLDTSDNLTSAVLFDEYASTGIIIAPSGDTGNGDKKNLYLKLTLSGYYGRSGSSIIAIYGEP